MKPTSKILLSIVTSAGLALTALQGHAAPVMVSISGFSFTPGNGYGIDADKKADEATLLDVRFNASAFVAQEFSLALGESRTFNVGTLNFVESDDHGGILSSETDNLDVIANFTFANPFGDSIEVKTKGTATTGAVSDIHTDLTIVWDPMQVSFGLGGMLEISLNALDFERESMLTQSATVKLLSAPSATVTQVPEPGSMWLAGLALAGLGMVRRNGKR